MLVYGANDSLMSRLGSVKKYMVHVYISSSGHLWPVFNRETLKIAQLFLLFLSFRSTKSDLNLSVFMYHVFLYGPLGYLDSFLGLRGKLPGWTWEVVGAVAREIEGYDNLLTTKSCAHAYRS